MADKNNDNRPQKFYGYEGQERLYSDPEDVVRYFMEDENYSDFPIKAYVFKQMSITSDVERFSRDILEEIIERLDDEYGDPDGDVTEPTARMKSASLELAKSIVDDYRSWMCESTGEVIEFSKEQSMEIIGEYMLEKSENIQKKKFERLSMKNNSNDSVDVEHASN